MTRDEFIAILARLGAYEDFVAWLRTLPPTATAADAWSSCKRGDWLVWLVGAMHQRGLVTRQTLVIAACAAARTALSRIPADESSPRIAIETAERWCRGEATMEEVQNAVDVAHNAACVFNNAVARARASVNFANFAFFAAWYAAYAVVADNCVYEHAYDEAEASALAANDAAYDAAYADVDVDTRMRRNAEIATAVRAVVPWEAVDAALRDVTFRAL